MNYTRITTRGGKMQMTNPLSCGHPSKECLTKAEALLGRARRPHKNSFKRRIPTEMGSGWWTDRCPDHQTKCPTQLYECNAVHLLNYQPAIGRPVVAVANPFASCFWSRILGMVLTSTKFPVKEDGRRVKTAAALSSPAIRTVAPCAR